jgi:putative hemolysin
LLIIVALVILNGVFSGAEIAVLSMRGSRIHTLADAGSRRARALQRLRANPESFLATVQIGITVIGAVAGAFGGATFALRLVPFLRGIPALAEHAESIALALVVVLVSTLSLVVGELVPKSIGLRFAERYALLVGRPLLGLAWLARPLVWFLTASSNVILRLFGDRTSFVEGRLSHEELQKLVDDAAKTGSVDPSAGEIASRALEFAGLTAVQVMVPRSRVVAVARDITVENLRRIVQKRGHTRMPVYEGHAENVIGYVGVKDILRLAWDKPLSSAQELVRPAYFVAETTRAVDLLNEMKRRRVQMAVVVNKQGAMSGLVTLEDLVEELVGEIFSEHDKAGPERIRKEGEGIFLVDGEVPLRDVNRMLSLDLPKSDTWSTIAGLCLDLAGRIPSVGERLAAPDGTVLEIADASPQKVSSVRVHVTPTSPGEGTEAGRRDE